MTSHLNRLIRQLADPTTQRAAREELQRLGPSIVPDPLAALTAPDIPLAQKPLMRVLMALRDERVAPAFRELLQADDEELRALAATGLHQLGTEDALHACLATINDAPDPLHYDVTPSVRALAAMGIAALPAILPLLASPDARTRQHAQKVLELVTLEEISRSLPTRSLPETARTRWETLWAEQGSYAWDASPDQRERAIARWKAWLEQRISAKHRSNAEH